MTTAARDAVHSVSETVTAAGTAAANAAGAAVDKVKEGVQVSAGTCSSCVWMLLHSVHFLDYQAV